MSIDANSLAARFREAGATLLSIPSKACLPEGMGASWPDAVHEVVRLYGAAAQRMRPPLPDPVAIIEMDEAWRWLGFLPDTRAGHFRQRIVLSRSMVDPLTDRQRFSWPKLSKAFGISPSTMQRMHADALEAIGRQLVAEQDELVELAA